MIGRRAVDELWADEDGLTTVEYAILLAVVITGMLGGWLILSDRVGATVTHGTETWEQMSAQ